MEIPASILQMKEKRVMIALLVNQNRKSKKIKTLEEIDSMTNEKRIKYRTKCTFCGKSDHVEYLVGLDWFCNKRCHYNYRHMRDKS